MNVFRMDVVGDATAFIPLTIAVAMIAALGMLTGQ
jgi:hypothetical protein